MEVERMQDRAQGRVWSGAAALEQGLVDAIGGVPRAIAIAKQAAKIGGELHVGFAGLTLCSAGQRSGSWLGAAGLWLDVLLLQVDLPVVSSSCSLHAHLCAALLFLHAASAELQCSQITLGL